MFGGLVFTFSSFNLLHFVHPNVVAVIAHIPWLLWAIDIVLVDSRRRRVALATALIALLTGSQLLIGHPQSVWYSLVAEFTYVITLRSTLKYAARAGCNLCATCRDCVGCTTQMWPRVVIAKGIGLLIGAVQLVPSLDAWLHSARSTANADFAFWGSLQPLNVLQLVAPYLFVDRVIGGNTHEFGLYMGAVPLLLVVWCVARRRELGRLGPLAWVAFGFGLLMLLLSLGQYGFVYQARRLAARAARLPLPLPLHRAVPTGDGRIGGDRFPAVDPRARSDPATTCAGPIFCRAPFVAGGLARFRAAVVRGGIFRGRGGGRHQASPRIVHCLPGRDRGGPAVAGRRGDTDGAGRTRTTRPP